jgi:tetratricopeptide (TPR) repeat protein
MGLSMFSPRFIAVLLSGLFLTAVARAGLHYSGESQNELPSQWRGFLLDQRTLRGIGYKPAAGAPANVARAGYESAATKLEKTAHDRPMTADEWADLGAIYLRLGEAAKAVDLLRSAQRTHPNHFRIASNLGTAWQVNGDLEQAAVALQQAVRLAPGKWQKVEECQLRLVRQRQREPRGTQSLDDLFGIRYVADSGQYEAGKLAADQRKKLASEALAQAQQLALWLPADPRLLWQLAELANAHGDIRTAAAMLDGCVEFGVVVARRSTVAVAAGRAGQRPRRHPYRRCDAGQLCGIRTAHARVA